MSMYDKFILYFRAFEVIPWMMAAMSENAKVPVLEFMQKLHRRHF